MAGLVRHDFATALRPPSQSVADYQARRETVAMKHLPLLAKFVLPALVLVAVALALWLPRTATRQLVPPAASGSTEPAQPQLAPVRPPAVASRQPIGPRAAIDFPQGVAWRGGPLTGLAWLPVRPHTAWLVVASAPGEDPAVALPMLRNLWASRDIAVVLLAAQPSAAVADTAADRQSADERWGTALDALAEQQPGVMAVLLGSGPAGEAALRWSADPRVLAVAALDAASDLACLQDPAWRGAAAKKHLWIGGPETRAQDADRLMRGLPHARAVTRGGGVGLQWLAVLDQRAALSGWLTSALGQ